MEAKLNDPDQKDKAEYSTAKEHHTLTKKEKTTSAKAENAVEEIYLEAFSNPYTDSSEEEDLGGIGPMKKLQAKKWEEERKAEKEREKETQR